MASVIKPNHIIIPSLSLGVLIIGRLLTGGEMGWYKTLKFTFITPPGWFIAAVWQWIFVLVTIVALYVWNSFRRDVRFFALLSLLILNGALNIAWSYFFFYRHEIGYAFLDALALAATTVALIILIRPVSRLLSWLLMPYAVWLIFAIALNGLICLAN